MNRGGRTGYDKAMFPLTHVNDKGLLLSSENVTLIVKRFCHPLSKYILKDLRHGWSGAGL